MERESSPPADAASASAGGGAAPPAPTAANQAPRGLTREYRSAEISVLWYAERCIHNAACIRALPKVFDSRRRPWVDLGAVGASGAAGADAIADAVLRCPTGALHYVRHDGGAPEPVPTEVTVRVVANGPLFVRGPVTVAAEDGSVLREDTRLALCRCGQSRKMPFCDNSHRAGREEER